MSFASYGELANTFQTRRLTVQIKQDMARLGMELSTGRKVDKAIGISGDFGPVAGLQHSLNLNASYLQSSREATILLGGVQSVLGNVQDQVQPLSSQLLTAISAGSQGLLQDTVSAAREVFTATVSDLNTHIGGRALFAGAATDGPALADANAMLSDLMGVIAGETTAAGVSARIDEWFNLPGGGFETAGYLGSDAALGPFPLRDGETVSQPVKADGPELRTLLASLAKSAVLADGALAGDVSERKELATQSATVLLSALDQLTHLRTDVGRSEAHIETASARRAAEVSALEMSYNALTAADPYETATAFQALYDQMESLYAVTARLSNLTFTDYMR